MDLKDFDAIYVVYEYQGADFKRLLKSPIHVENIHIQNLLYYSLLGLQYMHSCGLIHTNLRPENILVNEDCTIKICGFKFVKTLDEIKREKLKVQNQISVASSNESTDDMVLTFKEVWTN